MQTSANGATAPQVPPPLPEPIQAPTLNKLVELPLKSISAGLNPRKTFDEGRLAELAESLKAKGQQSPILVRPLKSGFQIVYGERRVRAARLAGWETIVALVRELSDQEAIEEALTENGARQDVDEYEEAEAFRQLRDTHHRSAEEIAARVGKSVGTIYARLKLAELDGKARELAREGGVPASTALLAARIVGAERQREAMKEIVEGRFDEGAMSYREAHEHIQRQYMLSLGDAQFDLKDEQLVPAAGSCTKCVKRTGNQRELFADIKAKDVCTDPGCFKEKQGAFVALRIERAKADGVEVLDDKKAKEVLGHGYVSGDFVDANEVNHADGKQRTYKESLGKKAPTPVLAKDPKTGQLRELLPREEVLKLTHHKERKPSAEDLKWKAEQEREQKKREKERAKAAELRAEAVKRATEVDFGAVALRGIVLLLAALDYDAFVEEQGWRPDGDGRDAEKIAFSKVVAMDRPELRGLLVAMALDSNQYAHGDDVKDARELLYTGLGVGGKVEKKPGATEKQRADAVIAGRVCAVPGCGEPGTHGQSKKFCFSHGAGTTALAAPEQKSILERNKKLAAQGSVKKLPPAKPAKKAKKK